MLHESLYIWPSRDTPWTCPPQFRDCLLTFKSSKIQDGKGWTKGGGREEEREAMLWQWAILSSPSLFFRPSSQRKQQWCPSRGSHILRPISVSYPGHSSESSEQSVSRSALRALQSGYILPTKGSILTEITNNWHGILRVCNYCRWRSTRYREEYSLIFKAQSWRHRKVSTCFDWLERTKDTEVTKGRKKKNKTQREKSAQWA